MKTLKDVQSDGDSGSYPTISLSKLMGISVVDVQGHITQEFGDPTFQMSRIVLSDGTTLWAEGEHDMPYLTDGTAKMDGEQMQALYDEEKA